MRNKPFGTISKVFFNKIVIEVPSPSDIQHNYKGDLYIIDGLNDFITIYKDRQNKYIYRIISLYEQEKPLSIEEESKFQQKAYFEAVPVGEVSYDEFEYGLSTFPMIGEEVYLTTTEDLQSILMPEKNILAISLGQLTTHEYIPQFSVDSLFTNHMAILGNTGSGKSTTVRKLLNELLDLESKEIDPNEMNFIVFDIHSEYKCFNSKYTSYIDVNEISIPLDTLTVDDWVNLVQPASAVQLPVLMNGLRMASILETDNAKFDWIKAYCALELYNNQQTDAVTKRTKIIGLLENIDSSEIKEALGSYNAQFGNFTTPDEENFKKSISTYIEENFGFTYQQCEIELKNALEEATNNFNELSSLKDGVDMILLLEESKGNTQVRTHCQTLMTRIENIIFTYSKSLFDTDPRKIDYFMEVTNFAKALTIFDCSEVDDNDLLFLSGYFSREVFEKQRSNKKTKDGISKSFNIILDEAHRYLTDDIYEERIRSIKVFEKIAKEGRKFGVFLTVASQRPSELSKTVLSQCNNFILHRIRNNLDLDQMRKSIPYINDSQLFRLSYLKTGVALMVGESFVIPMELLIDGEEYGKTSETVKPSKLWKKKESDQ